ncbi:hypothetical protein LX32DRAFT_27041 [Colletotrichum zoysiae]|uniref:Uncharacterized protein n=1 Tax=Colletotrichum zoysiae TaxID=1216348 RepID=A0AAD9HU69_9PEZI|nr:hypothetical protein LX32DRAFT_27041 [Colletotrichum zoysiae]
MNCSRGRGRCVANAGSGCVRTSSSRDHKEEVIAVLDGWALFSQDPKAESVRQRSKTGKSVDARKVGARARLARICPAALLPKDEPRQSSRHRARRIKRVKVRDGPSLQSLDATRNPRSSQRESKNDDNRPTSRGGFEQRSGMAKGCKVRLW